MAIKDYVGAIVCGIPHGGTTVVSEFIKSMDGFCGCEGSQKGFELGILLNSKPRQQKYNKYPMYRRYPRHRWGIQNDRDVEYCLDTDDFEECYKRIIEKSTSITEGLIVDKAPHYSHDLKAVIQKAPNVPVIVVIKDIRNAYMSYKKPKRGLSQFKVQGVHLYNPKPNASLVDLENEGKILLLKYDKFVRKDETELHRLSSYLKKDIPQSFFDDSIDYGTTGKINPKRENKYNIMTQGDMHELKQMFPEYERFFYDK